MIISITESDGLVIEIDGYADPREILPANLVMMLDDHFNDEYVVKDRFVEG